MAQQVPRFYRDNSGEIYYYVPNGEYFYCQRTNRAVARTQAAGVLVPCPPEDPVNQATPRAITNTPGQGRGAPYQGVPPAGPVYPSSPSRDASYAWAGGQQGRSAQNQGPLFVPGLQTGMAGMTLDAGGEGQDPARHRITTSIKTTQQGDKLLESVDQLSKVRTLVQRGPADRITDHDLHEVGVRAYEKLFETDGPTEQLYPTFRKRPSPGKFFVRGKVFLVLWAEPMGENNTMVTTQAKADSRFGEAIHSKVRRFVVVREGNNYCTALPVLSYNGQGVAKSGVKKSEHAIIFTGKTAPQPTKGERPVRGEAGMRPRSIRVDPDDAGTKLQAMSRIHFGRVYTIEHNIKVASFGMVNRDSIDALVYQFRDVWMNDIPAGPSQGPPAGAAEAAVPQQSPAQQVAAIKNDPRYQALLKVLGSHSEVAKDPRYQAIVRAHQSAAVTPQAQPQTSMSNAQLVEAVRKDPQYLSLLKELGDHPTVAKDPRYQQILRKYGPGGATQQTPQQESKSAAQLSTKQLNAILVKDPRYLALRKELGAHAAVVQDPRYQYIVNTIQRGAAANQSQQQEESSSDEEGNDDEDDGDDDDEDEEDARKRRRERS